MLFQVYYELMEACIVYSARKETFLLFPVLF